MRLPDFAVIIITALVFFNALGFVCYFFDLGICNRALIELFVILLFITLFGHLAIHQRKLINRVNYLEGTRQELKEKVQRIQAKLADIVPPVRKRERDRGLPSQDSSASSVQSDAKRPHIPPSQEDEPFLNPPTSTPEHVPQESGYGIEGSSPFTQQSPGVGKPDPPPTVQPMDRGTVKRLVEQQYIQCCRESPSERILIEEFKTSVSDVIPRLEFIKVYRDGSMSNTTEFYRDRGKVGIAYEHLAVGLEEGGPYWLFPIAQTGEGNFPDLVGYEVQGGHGARNRRQLTALVASELTSEDQLFRLIRPGQLQFRA